MTRDHAIHRRELRRLVTFAAIAAALVGSTWLVPQAATLRPWLPGEELPLVHLFAPSRRVVEDARGELVAMATPQAGAAEAPAPDAPEARLPRRPGAVPTLLENPQGALDPFFAALAAAREGEPGRIVRVLHWGDSTIAADGITSRVRERLQAHFGDGGPGFLAIDVDTRWQVRPNVLRSTQAGSWQTFNVTFAGSEHFRYGLGGNVSTAPADQEVEVVLGGSKRADGRQPLHRFDVFYQAQPSGGTVSVVPRGTGGALIATAAEQVGDRFRELKSEAGSTTLWIKTHADGPVTLYGVALETAGPGVTWETLAVAGSSISSMIGHQGGSHLKGQVARRKPDLLVYQTGGNELEYPDLRREDGSRYVPRYLEALGKIRAGAPEAPCLVVAPIDQGTRRRGEVVSQDFLDRIIQKQREAAQQAGCAFWDARAVMGGEGGFGRWIAAEPQLATTDLLHLTQEGFDLIGDCLADALLDAWEQWRQEHPEEAPSGPLVEPQSPPS